MLKYLYVLAFRKPPNSYICLSFVMDCVFMVMFRVEVIIGLNKNRMLTRLMYASIHGWCQ